MTTFKPIETQEDFDKAISDRLEREKKKYQDYEEIKTQNATLTKENGKLKEDLAAITADLSKIQGDNTNYITEIDELNAKIKEFESSTLKVKIALAHEIPYEFAERLVGDDEESMENDAKRIAEFFKVQEPVAPQRSNEPYETKNGSAYKALLNNLMED